MSDYSDKILMHLATCKQCQNTLQLAISVIEKHVKPQPEPKKDNG